VPTRAAFDFACTADQLEESYLGGVAVAVNGCGKKGVYVWSKTGAWVLDTASGAPTPAK
jgi:hypothetical protein